MESEPMLTPREKKNSTGSSEENQTHDAASRRIASPTYYRLSYSGPRFLFRHTTSLSGHHHQHHHYHRLNEPPAKGGSLEWAAPTGTQPCTVFGYKDFCGSTVLGTPESVGMNGQIDWQALQISHLVCSLAGQRCSEAWGTFSARTSQSMTALIAWRKEEWRKEVADIPPSKAENDLCSTRQILALFRGQPWGDC